MTFEEMSKFIDRDYESPIAILVSEMRTTMENDTMKVIHNYGIDVNKEELMKALAYDRNQYEKGYEDARKRFERPKGKWKCTKQGGIPISDMCTNCYYKTKWYKIKYNFCPECGAEMEASE